jgi:hypothetical protein
MQSREPAQVVGISMVDERKKFWPPNSPHFLREGNVCSPAAQTVLVQSWSSNLASSADALQDHVASGHTCSTRRPPLNKLRRDCSFICRSPLPSLCPQGVYWRFAGKHQRQQNFDVTSRKCALETIWIWMRWLAGPRGPFLERTS